MKLAAVVGVCLLASPVAAQSRVYTNADLGRPLAPRAAPSAEELRSLAALAYHGPPDTPDGPTAIITPYDQDWPHSVRLPVNPYWASSTYLGWPPSPYLWAPHVFSGATGAIGPGVVRMPRPPRSAPPVRPQR